MKALSSWWVLGALVVVTAVATMSFLFVKEHSKSIDMPDTAHDKEYEANGAAIAALWNTQTGYIERLSDELKLAIANVEAEKKQLQDTGDRVATEMKELKRLQSEIQAQRVRLDQTITQIETAELKNLRSQAAVYSNMEPVSVVQVFDEISADEAVKLLYFMGSDVQSEIFQAMIDADAEGALRVAELQEKLKFALPPQKKK